MPLCGIAPCAPLPWMVILNSLLDANTGPSLQRELAHRHAGPVVRAEDGLHRELARTGRPSSSRARRRRLLRPAGRSGTPCRRSCGACARCLAAASSIAVWPSWPQACILPACWLACAKRLCSVIGSASMSARRPTARLRAAVLHDADDAGLAHAAVDRDAPVGERLGDQVGGALLFEAELGVGMDVAAHARRCWRHRPGWIRSDAWWLQLPQRGNQCTPGAVGASSSGECSPRSGPRAGAVRRARRRPR